MRSVVISWTEVSTHSVTVTVPADFDPENAELGDALGELEDDGFLGVEREGIKVWFLDAVDPGAEVLISG